MFLLAHVFENAGQQYVVHHESPVLPSLGWDIKLECPWNDDATMSFVYRRLAWRTVGRDQVLYCLMEPCWDADFPTPEMEHTTANYLARKDSLL